ncbi:hypothetical protein FRC08_016951 [Ceratobasidium sp. 394]|nr:hypothetical protein FRC08_016951 [Ceratobasidium sp. 394]KAG9074166.1 hypothetical protein FS749_014300 [Ceratobasidium sp. UAMH 11750]
MYATKKKVPFWKYHFARLIPRAPNYLLSVFHSSELLFLNGALAAAITGEIVDPESRTVIAYWSSFIASGNPNTHQDNAAPRWPACDLKNETQLRFLNGSAFVEPDNIGGNATDFWRSIPDVLTH